MPENEHMRIIAVVREWIEKAENDLKNAVHTVEMGEACPTDTICFHAQQCVEKYLKAFLTLSQIEFSRTHDIAELTALMPEKTRPKLPGAEQNKLTRLRYGHPLPR